MSTFTLRPHQQHAVDETIAELAFGSSEVVIDAPTSFGKEQPYTEPVLTPDGFIPMGQLSVGSRVIGSDGQPILITHIHEQGWKDVYEISFRDGSSVRCGLDHLWRISKYEKRQQDGISESYLKYDTKSISELLNYSENSQCRFFVDLPSPVLTGHSDLPIDPYALGLLLGDGSFTCSTIGFSNRDEHIIDALFDAIPSRDKLGYIGFRDDGSKVDMNIISRTSGKTRSDTSLILESLELLGKKSTEKFIPNQYMTSSYIDRMKLLQGLIDTDGHWQTGTLNEYSSSSRELAYGVVDLARSLGIYVTISDRIPVFKDTNGQKKNGSRNYRVFLNFARTKKSIISIRSLGYRENSRCITVDSTDHLYITKDFTLTHNSSVIAGLCRDMDAEDIVILVNITELIDQIAEHLDYLGLSYSILKAGRESEFVHGSRIHIAMSQTLFSRIDKIDLSCDVIIQDEIHKEFSTNRTQTIIDKLQPDSRIGLSATPYDAKNFKLGDSTIIQTLSVQQLQDDGYLTPVRYFIPKWSEQVDYSSVKSTGADYTISKLDEKIATHQHIEQSLRSMNLLDAKSKKTIVFCSSIEQCELVTAAMRADGYAVEQVHSKQSKQDNENIISAFRDCTLYTPGVKARQNDAERTLFEQDNIHSGSEVSALVSVSKLSTGFDVKDIQLGVLMRPTKVLSLFIQQVGRLIRTAPGKKYAELLDLAQCTSRFGFHTTQFTPLEHSGNIDLDRTRKLLSDSEMELKHLAQTLPDDGNELQEFDFEKYALSIQKLAAKEKLLLEKKNDITTWTMKELASTYDYTDNIQTVIAIGAEIYTRKFGSPISKKGYAYSYDPEWISEGALVAFSKYPEKKRQWLKAYKTRCRNIIKQEKNFNSLKFFIDWLVERYESELIRY